MRSEPTLGDMWEAYKSAVDGKVRRSAMVNDKSLWKRLEPWKARRLSSFAQADFEGLHRTIGNDEGHTTQANRVLELAGKLFNWAIHDDDIRWAGRNPCRLVRTHRRGGGIQRFDETKRERHLNDRDPKELQTFLKLLSVEDDRHFRAFVLVSLFTGSRKTSTAAMRWGDLALASNEWLIPPGEGTKTRERTIRVQLAPGLVTMLQDLPHRHTDYVFRNDNGTFGLRKPWERIAEHFKDLTFHDLRRTTGAMLATLNASDRVIKSVLGHCNDKALEHYAHLSFTFPKWVKLEPIRRRLLAAKDKPALAYAEATMTAMLECGKTTVEEVMTDETA